MWGSNFWMSSTAGRPASAGSARYRSNWDKLTDELILHVFSFLGCFDLCHLSQANKRLMRLADDDRLWRRLYELQVESVYVDGQSGHFKRLFQTEVLDGKRNSQKYRSLKRRDVQSRKACCGGGTRESDMLSFEEIEQSPVANLHHGVKLVILGDVCTGKTSLLVRLVKDQFHTTHDATIGASYLTKLVVVDNVPVKLEIWDTAGSERYYSLAPMYYRGAVAAVIAYDITSEESFEKAARWVTELEEQVNPQPIMVLAGNKCDMEHARQVTKAQAGQFAESNNLIFVETSAKTGHNVLDTFLLITKLLVAEAKEAEAQSHTPKRREKGR